MSEETKTSGEAAETVTQENTATAAVSTSEATTESAEGQGQGEAETAGTEGEASTTKADTEEQGAPEAYEAFNLPEGYTLDGERAEAATALFKELNLPQSQAQKLVDAFCKADGENRSVLTEAFDAARAQRIEKWGEEAKTTFGSNFEAIAKDARAGVAHMVKTRPDTLKTFDDEGWGNHPDALAAFAEIGRLTRGSGMEGLDGETADPKPPSEGTRMYAYAGKPEKRPPE